MGERKKLIRNKIRTEQLKQTLIQSRLGENMIPLPANLVSVVSDTDDDDDDNDEEDNEEGF